jgi:hypothetical protein
MSSLSTLILQDKKRAEFGDVVARNLNNRYTVQRAGQTVEAVSAAGDIAPGSRAILLDTAAGTFIIGSDTRQSRSERKVIIHV